MGESPPAPSNSLTSVRCPTVQLQTLSTQRQHQIPQSSHARLTPLHQLQMPITTLGCHLCLYWTWHKLDILSTPSLGWINLLGQRWELRETSYLVDHWFITKEYNSETTKWVMGQHMGKRHVPLCSLWVYHLPPNLCTFTSLEALGTSYYWDFYGGFIMKAQSIINSVFRPSLFSRTW